MRNDNLIVIKKISYSLDLKRVLWAFRTFNFSSNDDTEFSDDSVYQRCSLMHVDESYYLLSIT